MGEPDLAAVTPLFDTAEGRAAIEAKRGEVTSAPAHLKAPEWLSPTGRKTFNELVEALRAAAADDALADVDVFALALAAEHYALATMASKAMRGPGGHLRPITTDEAHRDRLRKHPAVQVMRDATSVFTRVIKDFGGTPAARRALEGYLAGGGPAVDGDDEDDDLFGGAP